MFRNAATGWDACKDNGGRCNGGLRVATVLFPSTNSNRDWEESPLGHSLLPSPHISPLIMAYAGLLCYLSLRKMEDGDVDCSAAPQRRRSSTPVANSARRVLSGDDLFVGLEDFLMMAILAPTEPAVQMAAMFLFFCCGC